MKKYLPLTLRILVAIILIQTIRFKFTAHPDSVYIFSKVGMEPYGRIITGIVEFIAGVLILFSRTAWIGASLSLGIIGGAILMHLTKLGIEVNKDGGLLFITAIVTFILSGLILWNRRKDINFF